MGLRHSTQAGPPGQGCQSPVNNTALLVTSAATAAQSSYSTDNSTYISKVTNIRCTDEGELKTIGAIIADTGMVLPTGGAAINVFPEIKVKRPNCECTILEKFRAKHISSGTVTANVKRLTFDDGYQVNLGKLYLLLKVGTNGLEFVTVEDVSVNDYIVSCQSPGKTTDISSGCTKLTAKDNTTALSAGEVFFCRPETSYPQDTFGTSEILSALMLENGVYIFTIPVGGAY
jgi:hypothetical protein